MVTRNKLIGRLGLNFVERVALTAGCKPIPVPEDLDSGLDGFIEFDEAETPARLIAFQVKRGSSFFDGRGPKYRPSARHIHYWMEYPIPVILIVVREDESEAFWMDVRQHIRESPSRTDRRSFVMRPPGRQRFNSVALASAIRELARPSDFGDAISALSGTTVEARRAGPSLLYRFRFDRRTLFCLAAALHFETNREAVAALCDFYSRYLPHPEASFGVDQSLSHYAMSLLANMPTAQLLIILDAFNDDEHYGDWDGATEIFNLNEDEIWVRQDVIERGTIQQGVAQVVAASASPERLLSVAGDPQVSLRQRKSALALFGYLGYSCSIDYLDQLAHGESDRPYQALLVWLRHWIRTERGPAGTAGATTA